MDRAADEIGKVENGECDNNIDESKENMKEVFQLARKKCMYIYTMYDAVIEENETKIAEDVSFKQEGDKVAKRLEDSLAALRDKWQEFQTRYQAAQSRLDRLALARTPNAPRVRPATGLKPDQIGRDVKPAEFRTWLSKMKDYFNASHFDLEAESTQRAYFVASLDGYLSNIVHNYQKDNPSPETFGPSCSLEHCIRQHVDMNNPVYTRRRAFFSCQQKLGQDVQEHIAHHRRLAEEADTSTMTNDDWNTHVLVQSCLLYTSPSPRDKRQSRMPSSA